MKALSLRQPWADAVLYGGKRIENRVAWTNSNFRGEFLIHAAKGMTKGEYADVVDFLVMKAFDWRPKPIGELVRGAIVGRARVTGVVKAPPCMMTADQARWYMGGFALLLDDVVAFEKPIPWVGALGFFATPFDREGRRAP